MKEDTPQLWEEALLRLKVGEKKIKLATTMCKKGKYAEAILTAHHAVYHSARAMLYAKDIHPDTDSQAIEEFGLNFLQSGIIDKRYVKPYLTFIKMCDDETPKGDVFYSDKERTLHMLNDAKCFIKGVGKYIQKEIKRRKKLCQS